MKKQVSCLKIITNNLKYYKGSKHFIVLCV